MLDINLFRENPKLIRESIKKRYMHDTLPLVDEVIKLDKEWRQLKQEADELKHHRNEISREIAKAKKEGKSVDKLLKEASKIPKRIALLDNKIRALQEEIRKRLMRIPNLIDDSVPIGEGEESNEVVKTVGKPTEKGDWLKHHGQLAEQLGIADFSRSTKISGAGFYFLKGPLALLNMALIRFAIDFLIKRGFVYTEPPLMMRRAPYEGVVSLDDFETMMYKIEGEDAFLIATSEHPLVAQFMNEVLQEKQLPIKLVGYSMCFRKEIGSHGVDTKGLFRTHQFNKVEQIVICKPEQSWKFFKEIQENSEEMFKQLGIPFRVVNTASGELSIIAAKRFDIEAWMPRQKTYREVTSCSNCLDYQARRLNIRYFDKEGKRVFPHTLNNTGIATSRAMVAILENYQNRDGSVTIPKVLQKYMHGLKVIKNGALQRHSG
ncbi:serine--tRNA ligase [Candidatus Woesearchaeota archaeon]|nr:serine--tRNA ligase [Candidatus Woesearchaeota archaeon]RLE42943.1 MAG: serine--tRNA ligase [Candidatus Woesearchaeota archaeon]